MKYILTFLFVTLLFSCASTPKYFQQSAELTFKSVSLTNYYGATDAQHKKIMKEVDSVLKLDKPKTNSIALYHHIKNLDKFNLLTKPSIYLNIEKDSVITVHFSEEEYEKVKYFKYVDLQRENKKVILELDIIQKDKHIFYADKIISITKVDGQSKINGRHTKFLRN